MEWIETTLRKGTKTPKICRDMFLTDSRGKWCLCIVKNGRMSERVKLTKEEALTMIRDHKLSAMTSCFNSCFTYRGENSVKLVKKLLKN